VDHLLCVVDPQDIAAASPQVARSLPALAREDGPQNTHTAPPGLGGPSTYRMWSREKEPMLNMLREWL